MVFNTQLKCHYKNIFQKTNQLLSKILQIFYLEFVKMLIKLKNLLIWKITLNISEQKKSIKLNLDINKRSYGVNYSMKHPLMINKMSLNLC
jgi:hypothetical protein